MTSIGGFASSGGPPGQFDPTADNYFCHYCRTYVQAPRVSSGLRRCPTPGCTRPTGFGIYSKRPALLMHDRTVEQAPMRSFRSLPTAPRRQD